MFSSILLRLSLLVILMFIEACSSSAPIEQDSLPTIAQLPTLTHTTTAPAIPTPIIKPKPTQPTVGNETSCGVGLYDHNVRIWIEGQAAQEACSIIIALIRQQGSQPIGWDGYIYEIYSDYQPVCSDILPELAYEVVDTGSHLYGTEWCQWMVQFYGASGVLTEPDLMGIISETQ